MKFLCVGYFDPAKMQASSPEAVDAALRECPPHMDVLYETDKVSLVAGVENQAKYLRRVGGALRILDQEEDGRTIGCVFILEASTMEEAVQLASLHPTTQIAEGEYFGWYTEVRPIHYFRGGTGDLPPSGGSSGAAA